jgi:hypothetical protein
VIPFTIESREEDTEKPPIMGPDGTYVYPTKVVYIRGFRHCCDNRDEITGEEKPKLVMSQSSCVSEEEIEEAESSAKASRAEGIKAEKELLKVPDLKEVVSKWRSLISGPN